MPMIKFQSLIREANIPTGLVFFHGTQNDEKLRNISKNGFHISKDDFNGSRFYGNGVYFACPPIESYPCGVFVPIQKLKLCDIRDRENQEATQDKILANPEAAKLYKKGTNSKQGWWKYAAEIMLLIGYDGLIITPRYEASEKITVVVFNLPALNSLLNSENCKYKYIADTSTTGTKTD